MTNMEDIKGLYVWVLLTQSTTGDRVYTHGVYLSYDDLMAAIEEIESSSNLLCKVYDYTHIPLD